MFKAKCPLCNGLYRADSEWVGRRATCPHCHQKIIIQTAETEPAPLVEPTLTAVDDNTSKPADLSIPMQVSNPSNDGVSQIETLPNTLSINDNPKTTVPIHKK